MYFCHYQYDCGSSVKTINNNNFFDFNYCTSAGTCIDYFARLLSRHSESVTNKTSDTSLALIFEAQV